MLLYADLTHCQNRSTTHGHRSQALASLAHRKLGDEVDDLCSCHVTSNRRSYRVAEAGFEPA